MNLHATHAETITCPPDGPCALTGALVACENGEHSLCWSFKAEYHPGTPESGMSGPPENYDPGEGDSAEVVEGTESCQEDFEDGTVLELDRDTIKRLLEDEQRMMELEDAACEAGREQGDDSEACRADYEYDRDREERD